MLHTFLEFELDEAQRELRFQGRPVSTQGRVFDLIAYLLHARERVVSRDELLDALWQGNVVSDAAISQVIMLARKALHDEGESQHVIKTVRGRGIRFVAPVVSRERKSEPPNIVHTNPEPRVVNAAPAPALVEGGRREPLLGRSSELRTLLERLGRAELGHGSLILIEGEPGVGKTTLAEGLAREAEERGFEVIWGRAWEGGGAPPFWPWIQVLRTIAQREGSERLREWLGGSGSELLPLLPELGSAAPARSDALSQELDGARARFRQFDVLSRLLRHLCGRAAERRRPWLIVLDDLHATDDASVQLVRFLMPDLGDLGLLLVGTYRGLECPNNSVLGALGENCADHTLHLRGLAPHEVEELLVRRLGRPVEGRLAATFHNVSAGNPLLLAELCARLEGDPREPLPELTTLADFALPERIASAVRRHLLELPRDTRSALSAASALGREFSQALLAQLLGCTEAALIEWLAPARRRGVLRAAKGVGRLLFSHVLVCNAIYAELDACERLRLHGRIGELLEREHAEAGAALPLPVHELAHHYYLAASEGARAKALSYTEQAAAQACSVMAHESGAALYDRAIALLELEGADSAHLYRLLMAGGAAYTSAGHTERGVACCERAASVALAAGDVTAYAEAIIQSGCTLRGEMLHHPQRQARARAALDMLPEGDSAVRARLLGVSMLGRTTVAERRAATHQAVEMARRLGDADVLMWTLNARHLVLWGGAPPEELLVTARELCELSRRHERYELMLDALLWCVCDLIELGDMLAMQRLREEYMALVDRYGSPWHRYVAVGGDILTCAAFGDLNRAREHSSAARALGRRVQDGLADTFHELRIMFYDLLQGREESRADNPFATIEPPAGVAADYRVFWALNWANRGYTTAARSVLLNTLEQQDTLIDSLRRPVLAMLAEVAVLLDERAAIAQLYELLLPSSGRHLLLQACVYMGPVDYYLGLLAAALGRNEEACQRYQSAIDGTISPVVIAQAQYALGRALVQQEAHEHARRLLTSAREHGQRFGFSPLNARADAALAAL